MLKEIGELRKRIDVPLGEAMRLIEAHDGDVLKSYGEALRERASPIVSKTGVSIEQAAAAFDVADK